MSFESSVVILLACILVQLAKDDFYIVGALVIATLFVAREVLT